MPVYIKNLYQWKNMKLLVVICGFKISVILPIYIYIYIGIMIRCVIFPLLFILEMKMILCSAKDNTNKINGPSVKAFMDDVTLIAESRSHMEQLVSHLQELFKWAEMKIKLSKCSSLSILKGVCKEIKFSINGNEIHTIGEKSVKSLGRCYSLQLTDQHHL